MFKIFIIFYIVIIPVTSTARYLKADAKQEYTETDDQPQHNQITHKLHSKKVSAQLHSHEHSRIKTQLEKETQEFIRNELNLRSKEGTKKAAVTSVPAHNKFLRDIATVTNAVHPKEYIKEINTEKPKSVEGVQGNITKIFKLYIQYKSNNYYC